MKATRAVYTFMRDLPAKPKNQPQTTRPADYNSPQALRPHQNPDLTRDLSPADCSLNGSDLVVT